MKVISLKTAANIMKSDWDYSQEITFSGVSIDTRTIRSGDVYFALKGERFDGHDFVGDALKKGAVGAVVKQNFQTASRALVHVDDPLTALQDLARHYRQHFKIPIVAITGSHGKTTTKDILASVFQQNHTTHKTEKNLNGIIGVPLTLLGLEDRHSIAVVEVGISIPGEMNFLAELVRPTHAIITCIAPSHIEFLKDIDTIRQEKSILLDYVSESGYGILNADDPYVIHPDRSIKSIYFGLTKGDVVGRILNMSIHSTQFQIESPFTDKPVNLLLPLSGKHNVTNALAAYTAAKLMNIADEDIQAGFKKVHLSPHRSRILEINEMIIIDDTYNSAPLSLKNSLEMLKMISASRRTIIVLGDMLELGDQTEEAHFQIGKLIAEFGFSRLYCYGPHMSTACVSAQSSGMSAAHFSDSNDLLRFLLPELQRDDIILVKASRGMKAEVIVDGICRLFADNTPNATD